MKSKLVLMMLLLVFSLGFAEQTNDVPFGAWMRASEQPILSPQGTTWESAGTFNPAVVLHNRKFVMLYRAQDASGTSRLGYAESADGLRFTRRPEPVLSPETDYEKDGGVEDPRLQKFGHIYYLTYTGYNKKDGQLCLATSRDLIHWERQRRDSSGVQREMERGLDEIGRDCADRTRWIKPRYVFFLPV